MKKFLIILIALFTINAVSADELNTDINECLQAHGYNKDLPIKDRFNGYDLSAATKCMLEKRTKQREQRREQYRVFLEKNPWYRGPNWRWEIKSEYKCSQVWSEEKGANITLCQKPFYLQ